MEIEKKIADRGKRFLAYLIDVLPITLLVFGVFYLFLGFDETLDKYLNRGTEIEPRIKFMEQRNWIRDISLLIWIIYCIIFEASPKQGTIGKSLMEIKVVDNSGNRLTLYKSLARNLSKILSYSIIALGFIWILFDKKRQGWHDKLNNTYVVSSDYTNEPVTNNV
jgi:uncharacterized RDD family membrane protein YckC